MDQRADDRWEWQGRSPERIARDMEGIRLYLWIATVSLFTLIFLWVLGIIA